ncbi:hypothetical protein AB205_0158490, partial [Aquarana catesbeiana]
DPRAIPDQKWLYSEVIYFSLLASESGEYFHQALKRWSSNQLFATIRLAHSLVDQCYMLFGEVQPLIKICTELALPCIPEGHDDFTPPFNVNQVVSLVWLFEDDPVDFCEHYRPPNKPPLPSDTSLPKCMFPHHPCQPQLHTLLPTKYSYPVSAPCTYPAFNPPASSQLPTNPQDLPPATVTSSLPYPNPSFQSAAPLTYSAS